MTKLQEHIVTDRKKREKKCIVCKYGWNAYYRHSEPEQILCSKHKKQSQIGYGHTRIETNIEGQKYIVHTKSRETPKSEIQAINRRISWKS